MTAGEAAGRRRTALFSLAAAGVLVVLKLGTGVVVGSLALISAGVESSGDVVAALLTLVAVRFGLRPADISHPYGHRRVENLAALGEAAIIAFGAVVISYEAIRRLTSDAGKTVAASWPVFAVVGVAIVIDASRVATSLRASRRYGSAAFRSNAFNFAGDLVGSVAVLIGLAVLAAGVAAGDAVAALVVACLVFAAAGRLVVENARALMDYAPPDARRGAEQALAGLHPPVELRRMRLRESGGRIFADVTVGLPPAAAVIESHDVADRVEQALHGALPESDIIVHVEPTERGVDLRGRVLAAALAEPAVREVHDIAILEHDNRATVTLHLKVSDQLTLPQAHDIANRVETSVRRLEGVEAVQTHLEPLDRPTAAHRTNTAELATRRRRIAELTRAHTGQPPRAVRLVASNRGLILLLTITLAPATTLSAAHDLAGKLEKVIRVEQPDLAEVVIHTEPESAPSPRS